MSGKSLLFIYEDSYGNITARQVTDVIEDEIYVKGFCHTANDQRTFRKDRILEKIKNPDKLQERLKYYQSKPDNEDLEVLKFFKVKGYTKMSKEEMSDKAFDILENPENEAKWEKHQEELEAEEDRLQDIEDAKEERAYFFESVLEDLNEFCREDYCCKKISKKLFKEVVEILEEEGHTLDEIEENEEIFFTRLFEIAPEMEKKTGRKKTSAAEAQNSCVGCIVIIIIAIYILFKIL